MVLAITVLPNELFFFLIVITLKLVHSDNLKRFYNFALILIFKPYIIFQLHTLIARTKKLTEKLTFGTGTNPTLINNQHLAKPKTFDTKIRKV